MPAWRCRRSAVPIGAIGLAVLALAGCVTQLGPRAIPPSRQAYNEAIARSWDEQLLLNRVRLRYRDTPVFLDVGSITSQFSLGVAASGAVDVEVNGGTTRHAGAGAGVSWEERPTVTYGPLQGEDFVTRLLSPITPSTLVLLSQSGWSIERLLDCCVQRINDLENAVAAAGPTPDDVPPFRPFHRLAALLRELQVAGLLRVEPDRDGSLVVELPEETPAEWAGAIAEARSLLGVPGAASVLKTVPSRRGRGEGELAVTGRSLLAVLFFLSQAVEVPAADADAGLVTITHDAAGGIFDWGEVTDRLFAIRSGEEPPAGAAVAVAYRGHWFWVAADDSTSKSTLNLVSLLCDLEAGSRQGKEPLPTLGVD